MIVMTDRIQSWNFTASFHYTHEPRRVAMQITLSSRYDYDELAVPISRAIGVFTRITNAGAEVDLQASGNVSNFIAGELTETHGLFSALNCYANGTINQFQWS